VDDPSASATVRLRSGEEILLRPLQGDDAAALGDYFLGLLEATRRLYSPHPFDRETAEKLCTEIDPNRALTMIATRNTGEVIGYFIIAWGAREGEMKRYAGYGIALDLATTCSLAPSVADAYQNQGLGSLMMQHVASVVRRMGLERMILSGGTQCGNVRAIHFYEKHGFVKVGQFGTEVANQDMVLDL